MNFFLKKLLAPLSNEQTQLSAAQLWYVRWTSRAGEFHSDVQPEVEAFPSQADAEHFAESLRAAFKLVRHYGKGTRVVVKGDLP